MKKYMEAGRAASVHGVRGELKVYPYCDSAEMFASFARLYFDAAGRERFIPERSRPVKNMVILKIPGVDTVEEARKYVGKLFYFDRGDAGLADGVYFVDDLLGSSVEDADSGRVYGTVADITHNGAHGVYHVKTPGGELRFVPAAGGFITEINAAEKIIKVRPIPGMLED